MALDWVIAASGDIMFDARHDFQITSGTKLLEQRMILRCRIFRGSYIFHPQMGSRLDEALRDPRATAIAAIPSLIEDALLPMREEIDVVEVQVMNPDEDKPTVDVVIRYHPVIPVPAEMPFEPAEVFVTFPILNIL